MIEAQADIAGVEDDEMTDEQTDDTKTLWGMPMRWEARNMLKNVWNPDDQRVFPPKYFGIGWDLNLWALGKKVGLVRE